MLFSTFRFLRKGFVFMHRQGEAARWQSIWAEVGTYSWETAAIILLHVCVRFCCREARGWRWLFVWQLPAFCGCLLCWQFQTWLSPLRQVCVVWCVCVYECIHLPDLALAAQSGVCVCEWVISYPQGVGVCTYSRPGCPCSLSCEWHDVCVYIFQTWLPPLTQVCVVFVCICVVCLFAYVCVHLSVCLSLSLFICLSLREVKLHP